MVVESPSLNNIHVWICQCCFLSTLNSILFNKQRSWKRQPCSQIITWTAAMELKESLNTRKPPAAHSLQPKHRMWSILLLLLFCLISLTKLSSNVIILCSFRHYLCILAHPLVLSDTTVISQINSARPPQLCAS